MELERCIRQAWAVAFVSLTVLNLLAYTSIPFFRDVYYRILPDRELEDYPVAFKAVGGWHKAYSINLPFAVVAIGFPAWRLMRTHSLTSVGRAMVVMVVSQVCHLVALTYALFEPVFFVLQHFSRQIAG